jgi:hypothetical protein
MNEVPEPRNNRPLRPAGPLAPGAAPLAFVFESSHIVGRTAVIVGRHRLGADRGRWSGWTAGAHFQAAGDRHRQAAVCRLLKNRGGVLRLGQPAGIHGPNTVSRGCHASRCLGLHTITGPLSSR